MIRGDVEDHLEPCFSIYFSSRNTKRASEITEEHQLAHNNSNVNFMPTIVYLSSTLYVKESAAKPKQIDRIIDFSDTSTMASLLIDIYCYYYYYYS
jgi:hypothetical protein